MDGIDKWKEERMRNALEDIARYSQLMSEHNQDEKVKQFCRQEIGRATRLIKFVENTA